MQPEEVVMSFSAGPPPPPLPLFEDLPEPQYHSLMPITRKPKDEKEKKNSLWFFNKNQKD